MHAALLGKSRLCPNNQWILDRRVEAVLVEDGLVATAIAFFNRQRRFVKDVLEDRTPPNGVEGAHELPVVGSVGA